MKTLTPIAALAALLTLTTAAFAADTTVKTPAKSATLVCPVTGDKIASVKDAVGHSTYKGKTYYFCCPSCKPEFDANPAKYAKPAVKPVAKKAA